MFCEDMCADGTNHGIIDRSYRFFLFWRKNEPIVQKTVLILYPGYVC